VNPLGNLLDELHEDLNHHNMFSSDEDMPIGHVEDHHEDEEEGKHN